MNALVVVINNIMPIHDVVCSRYQEWEGSTGIRSVQFPFTYLRHQDMQIDFSCKAFPHVTLYCVLSH